MLKEIILTIFTIFFYSVFMCQNTCSTALVISEGTYTVSEINGTEAPIPICAPNGVILPANYPSGEWYKFVVNQKLSAKVSTDLPNNLGKDTRFHIYKGSCGNLTCVTGDDDSGTDNLSVSIFNVYPGNTYYIAFDNKWSSAGFDFTLSFAEALPISFESEKIVLNTPISCVADMNNDFLDDIVSVSSNTLNILKQNLTNGFTLETYNLNPPVKIPDWSIAAGDFDKNKYNDLAIGNSERISLIKANNTGTSYSTKEFPEYIFSQRTNFVDINNDGHLDLWACNDTSKNNPYKNDGAGNLQLDFSLISTLPVGGNYSSVWTDYNNDGNLDLYISKCKGGVPENDPQRINLLYKNNGNGTFSEVGAFAGVNDSSQTWATAAEDFDNDGDIDFIVCNVSNTNRLYRNNGDGTFTDVFSLSNISPEFGSLEIQAADFNNDGFVDFIWQNSKQIYINNGNLTFTGYQVEPKDGGIGDLNNDGFLDIQSNDKIFFNIPNANHWIKVNLIGLQSNRNGIGARIEIYGTWGKQIREIRSGHGFSHMSSLSAYFGIGSATKIEKLIIKWPSGIIDTIINPNIDSAITVTEGSNSLSIEDLKINPVKIYPNPAQDFFYISNVDDIKIINIYDNSGRLVLIGKTDNNKVENLALRDGIYFIEIKTEKNIYKKKLIIKKKN